MYTPFGFYTSGITHTVTGNSTNSFISLYSLFGDISTYKIGQTKNLGTGITLKTPEGTKRIITQIYS
jgi:hypothetical protein